MNVILVVQRVVFVYGKNEQLILFSYLCFLIGLKSIHIYYNTDRLLSINCVYTTYLLTRF